MARRVTAIVLLLAAAVFGVDRLVSSSGRQPREPGRSTTVAAAIHATAAPRRAAPTRVAPAPAPALAPAPPFQADLLHAPPALRQQLLRMLALAEQFPRRTPRRVSPPLLPRSLSCSIAGGCSLKPCVYEAYVETVAAVGAAATVLLPNRPVPSCVHPPPIRISAP